jgi:hypothetical protein
VRMSTDGRPKWRVMGRGSARRSDVPMPRSLEGPRRGHTSAKNPQLLGDSLVAGMSRPSARARPDEGHRAGCAAILRARQDPRSRAPRCGRRGPSAPALTPLLCSVSVTADVVPPEPSHDRRGRDPHGGARASGVASERCWRAGRVERVLRVIAPSWNPANAGRRSFQPRISPHRADPAIRPTRAICQPPSSPHILSGDPSRLRSQPRCPTTGTGPWPFECSIPATTTGA